jgi:hypothetical protein
MWWLTEIRIKLSTGWIARMWRRLEIFRHIENRALLCVAWQTFARGKHSVSIRVIAADRKAYSELRTIVIDLE